MSYALTMYPSMMTGAIGRNWLLRDHADDIDYRHFETDALVASGDYFKALSSMIDMISFRLEPHSPIEATDLQTIVEQLEYIDTKYKICKRKVA